MKYRSLLRLLQALEPHIQAGRLRQSEGWRDNEQALGLELADAPSLSAYVFTYGQPDGRYGVELGYPDIAAATAAGTTLLHEALRLDSLIAVLGSHFELSTEAWRPGKELRA